MSSKKRFVIPAVLATLAVVGCSSDSDDGDGGTTTEGTTTEGTTTEGTTTEGTTTEGTTTEGTTTDGTASASFFNDDSGLDFANGLGGSISQIFSSAFSAAPLLLGGGFSGDGEAPRMARATNAGSDACLTSGSVDFTFVTNDATGDPESASILFNECDDEGELSTGSMNIAFGGNFNTDNGSITVTFDNFTVSDDGETSNIDGDISMGIATVGDTTTATVQGNTLSLSTTGVGGDTGAFLDNLRNGTTSVLNDGDSSVTFDSFNLTSTTNDTSGDSSVGGEATITTLEAVLLIAINPALQIIGDADFPTTGVVSMISSDGSSLEINADSGDPATYNYIINDQGAVSSGTANWADTGIEGLDTEL